MNEIKNLIDNRKPLNLLTALRQEFMLTVTDAVSFSPLCRCKVIAIIFEWSDLLNILTAEQLEQACSRIGSEKCNIQLRIDIYYGDSERERSLC